jgi:NAD+ synthase (glutamine-hydrolysing)
MDRLRIAGANVNQLPLDWEGNVRRLEQLIKEAREQHVAVLCFPELCITGYNCEDMFLSVHTARMALQALDRLSAACQGITVVFGLPVYHKGSMYNCAGVVQDQKVLGLNPKKLLAREGVHYESRWFRPWPFGKRDVISFKGTSIPFGDFTYQLGSVQLGIVICEEAWSSEGTASDVALSRCELIVNLSASHFALGKSQVRETLVRDASRAFQAFYLYTNLLGLEAGRQVYDGDVLLGECGQIERRAERFSFEDGNLLIRDIDLDLARVAKLKSRSVLDSSVTRNDDVAVAGVALSKVDRQTPAIESRYVGLREDPYDASELEFLQVEKLGLFDYVRKSGSRGLMLSLSGGCDSSAIAVLCGHMIAEALKALGPDRFAERIGWPKPKERPDDPRSWIQHSIMTVYQATQQSGPVTLKAAEDLARELGTEHTTLSIEEPIQAYLARAAQVVGRSLTWDQDDLALQNIQARARAPMVWLLANLKGYLLLSTSNRSEVAVGYATMDGDTAGGLAPLAGIDKHYLRHWLRWAETSCPLGLGPISSLALVNQQDPTAELRPRGAGQKDEIDLMPYAILNVIETAFVRDRMEPESIMGLLKQRFEGYSDEQLRSYLGRFYRLWSRNQWKRERYAPGFHIDDYSLDPKSWCRYPILSAEVQLPES